MTDDISGLMRVCQGVETPVCKEYAIMCQTLVCIYPCCIVCQTSVYIYSYFIVCFRQYFFVCQIGVHLSMSCCFFRFQCTGAP